MTMPLEKTLGKEYTFASWGSALKTEGWTCKTCCGWNVRGVWEQRGAGEAGAAVQGH